MEFYLFALSVLIFSVAFYLSGSFLRSGPLKYSVVAILFVMGVALLGYALDSWTVFLVSIISSAMTLAILKHHRKNNHQE